MKKKTNPAKEWKEKSNKALNVMHKALGEGKSEPVERLMNGMARLSKYSFRNQMLIILQCPRYRYVRGYNEWQNFGRQVQKGQKGIAILAPCIKKAKVKGDADKIWFKGSSVFDISQTDGPPLGKTDYIKGDPGPLLGALELIVVGEGVTIEYVESILGGAQGISRKGAIEISNALGDANKFSVLTHELAHELMHGKTEGKATNIVQREVEAECVAAAVCGAVGLDAARTHVDYVQLYSDDVKLFESCLGRIQKTVKRILTGLEAVSV